MITFNGTLILTLISFAVFMFLMKIVYFDPILAVKEERERRLSDDKDAAQRFSEEFARIQADYEQNLRQARKEAHQIIQEIRQQAKSTAQDTLNQARQDAQQETDRQLAELNAWREETYQQLADERAALTQTIIQKVTAGPKVQAASGG